MTDSMTSSMTDSMTSSMTDSTTDSMTSSMTDATTDSMTTTTTDSTTTSDATASSRALDFDDLWEVQDFSSAIVTTSNGEQVDIETILPTKVEPSSGRSDLENEIDVDGIIGETMMSGKLDFKEV